MLLEDRCLRLHHAGLSERSMGWMQRHRPHLRNSPEDSHDIDCPPRLMYGTLSPSEDWARLSLRI